MTFGRSRASTSRLGLSLTTLAAIAGGCGSGSQQRAGDGAQYDRYVSSLYNQPAARHGPRTVEFPVNVAVAQVGRTAPSPRVLQRLGNAHDVFNQVASIPDASPIAGADAPAGDPMPRLQRMARDLGADYLLIYGATVETHTRVTPLSALDLTIVGAFAVPSREIRTDARASAALIDVRSGTIVLTAGAEDGQTRYASAAAADGEQDKLQALIDDQSSLKLADQLITSARQRNAQQGEGDSVSAPSGAVSSK